MRVGPSLLFATALCAVACGKDSQPFVDGGVARVLEILKPPGQQIGLKEAQTIALRVRYRLDDPEQTVIHGQQVSFSIVTSSKDDDPGDSTISHDSDATDSNGIATVNLTSGDQDGLSFGVQASAPGAADVVFDVSVSNQAFVTIDAVVSDPLPQPGSRDLVAALFSGKTCADLALMPTLMGASRTLSAGASTEATLTFENLLSRTYALVGRVTDQGALVAYGCADIGIVLVPPGTHLTLPVPMYAVSPSVTGTFDIETSLDSGRAARADDRFAPIDVVDRCTGHAGQLLLDAMLPLLPTARAQLVTSARGATMPSTDGSSTVGCYGDAALDAALGAMLAATVPGQARAALISDLDALLAGGTLRSSLSLAVTARHADDGPAVTRYTAMHTAEQVTLMLGSAAYTYDLTTYALPLVAASAIDATVEADTLTIGPHELTLGLPMLWGDAFAHGSLAARVPSLATDTWSAWLAAAVGAAQHGGQTGCAAVEDLICAETGTSGCAGTIVDACTTAVTSVGATLDGVFTDAPTMLTGTCATVDDNGDLVADALAHGVFTATGPTGPMLPFSATRGM